MNAKLGDVLEIPTSKGLFYAQYTHQHAKFGGLIRAFDIALSSRPTDYAMVALGAVRFSVFFPVRAAVRRKVFAVVANAPVAPSNQAFPLFRDGIADPRTKRVATWWLWDGDKEWPIGSITDEQRKLPIRQIWNDSMLIARLEKGWRPETDPE